MKNRITEDETKVENSTNVEACSVCPNNAKPIVSGSASPGFLLDAVNKLFTYKTPKNVIDFINKSCIIGNPLFTKKNKI